MRVVRLRHGAVACALPIEQADVAERDAPSAEVVTLWDRHAGAGGADDATARFLRVRTSAGWRSLPCEDVALAVVDDASRWELPSLVRELLAMPHVVGVIEVDGAPVWLLDLERWA